MLLTNRLSEKKAYKFCRSISQKVHWSMQNISSNKTQMNSQILTLVSQNLRCHTRSLRKYVLLKAILLNTALMKELN